MFVRHRSRGSFQVTPQLLIIVLLVLVALALPIAVTVWFTADHFQNKRVAAAVEPPVEVDVPGLRESFESIATGTLGEFSGPLDAEAPGRITVSISSDVPLQKMDEVSRALTADGVAVIDLSEPGEGMLRLLATFAPPQAAAFIVEHGGDAGALPSGAESVLVEIVFAPESQSE